MKEQSAAGIDKYVIAGRKRITKGAAKIAVATVAALAATAMLSSCITFYTKPSDEAANNCQPIAQCPQNTPAAAYTTAPTVIPTLMATAMPSVEDELEHSELICSDYILTPTPSITPLPLTVEYNALARWELHNPNDAVPNGMNGETITMEQIIAQYFSGTNPTVGECKIKTVYVGRLYDVIERHIDYNELENRVVVIDELRGCSVYCPSCYTPQAPTPTYRPTSTPTYRITPTSTHTATPTSTPNPTITEEPGRTEVPIPTAIVTDDPFNEATPTPEPPTGH